MRLLLKANVFGWVMTGIMGKGAKWFFGFSRQPTEGEVKHRNEISNLNL